MNRSILVAALAVILIPCQVHAQNFAYQRTVQFPAIDQETSVWIPLDLHALQQTDAYQLVNGDGEPQPWKLQREQINLLTDAEVLASPEPADTVPAQRLQDLIDNNPSTSFQPVAGKEHTFRFVLPTPAAPDYLQYQLASGWIEHVKVRIGLQGQPLRDAYVGTPRGTNIQLSGERADVFEITFRTSQGVLKISEAILRTSTTKLLFRATPGEIYRLRYGTTDSVTPVSGESVFTDANALTATLGPVIYIGDQADDSDGDNVPDVLDNCPASSNTNQTDRDGDGIGDVCDNAALLPNTTQQDSDKDGVGNAQDNCPNHPNSDQKDIDLDGKGWVCDDADGDGIINSVDNCVGLSNRDQLDLENDGIGDACQDDRDQDGVPRTVDNCSTTYNPDQSDEDRDGIGDACDVCPMHYDPKQIDRDENGIGDVCQRAMEEAAQAPRDTDEDSVPDKEDNCPTVANPDQSDSDTDGIGNACDNCPVHNNSNQRDGNRDGMGDVCTDTDGDGILDPLDNCAPYANTEQHDKDEDGIGDPCDDDDGDRIENARDNCQYDYNPYQGDEDKDGIGNPCDTDDNRWTAERPWVLYVAMIAIVVMLTGLGALILKKTS